MTFMRSGIELQELKGAKPQQYCVVQFSSASLRQEFNYEKHDSKKIAREDEKERDTQESGYCGVDRGR